jgi:hypothetical protein
MLETVFDPSELVTVPESSLAVVPDADTRQVLGTLGVPFWENPWFDMDDRLRDGLPRVTEWDSSLSARFGQVPEGADNWVSLGLIPYDDLAFDPVTGKVYCCPQEGEIYLLNSKLRNFVHFHYLLRLESPNYEWESSTEAEREAVRLRVREAMTSLDPAALENPESRWIDILQYIVDPDE